MFITVHAEPPLIPLYASGRYIVNTTGVFSKEKGEILKLGSKNTPSNLIFQGVLEVNFELN